MGTPNATPNRVADWWEKAPMTDVRVRRGNLHHRAKMKTIHEPLMVPTGRRSI